MSERCDMADTKRRHLIFLTALLVVSFTPLMFLDLAVADQLASALALPLAVTLAMLSEVSPIAQSGAPFPWRRVLATSAAVIAAFGVLATGYAVVENTKDLDVVLSGYDKEDKAPLTHGGVATLTLPDRYSPPPRDNLTLVVSLDNLDKSGDCENTALLDIAPVLDDNEKKPTTVRSGTSATISLRGTQNTARVKVTVRYEAGNVKCKVQIQVDKAVLHD